MEACSLCRPELGPVLASGPAWKLVLNRNQNLLGKCFWVLQRHLESVAQLTHDEWYELQPALVKTTQALVHAFQPDHFNYAFLQNQDRHVHLHIIPRYATPRHFEMLTFPDPDYPGHYAVPAPVRQLPPETMGALASYIQTHLEGVIASIVY